MKPLLSDNGSVELGFGVLLTIAGALHYVFPDRDASAFESGLMLVLALPRPPMGTPCAKRGTTGCRLNWTALPSNR